ncbi:TolB-like translocation protein [Lutispora thermophila]|uniref:Uncharacterized protein n=1 Tax=Lutispora thermophila DSM 19022 TaxID=1122184 RepID=A0A1M6EL88_9FIRM|nr:hypothetical protein [Lutispora thermophila]SHI86166.1 hypothetical protein SAMN02745176_01626 [Lutispora thermophila DSM 19022]
MKKGIIAIILVFSMIFLVGCGKEGGTTSSSQTDKALKPLAITMDVDDREISLMKDRKGTFDKPFQLNFWFNGKLDLNEDSVKKYLTISPDMAEPDISIISNDEIHTTRICVEFKDTKGLSDEINIVLKAGIVDDNGAKLSEDISILLSRQKQVEAYIKLKDDPTINSDTGYDFNTYILDEKDKYFEVTFNYPMNRESVESAFIDGFKYVPEEYMAKLELEWKDDANLTIAFKNLYEGQAYPISFNGAKTTTGEEYKEFEMNKVFGFLVQKARKVSKVDANGNIVSDMPIKDEILELDDISPDGKYAFGYRLLDNGGDFYPVKPILLELDNAGVKKHFLKGIDYIQSIIFGARWMPDGKSFIVYTSKKILYYSLNEALEGKPGEVIFEYAPTQMDYILGAEISPDGSQIAVFKSEYKDSNEGSGLVDIYCIDFNGKNIQTVEDVFYHTSSDGFVIPLKYSWKDNNTIISEGYSQKSDKANVYSIDLKNRKADIIIEDASNPSILGNIMVIRKTEYDEENGYMAYGDGHIINMNNKNIENVITGNLSYSVYGLKDNSIIAYELYEDYYNTFIYDRTKDTVLKIHQGMIFGSDKENFYILR